MTIKKNFFVTLEGIDGAGKTTQVKLVSDILTARGYQVVSFREPGSTDVGNEIRKLLFNKEYNLDNYTELFLFLAARTELITKIIKNIEPGTIVIGDRFWDSTIAYQHYGKGLSIDLIEQIRKTAPFNMEPNLTVWLDIPVELSLQREDAGSNISDHGMVLLNKVTNGFRALHEANPDRIVRLDGTSGQADITAEITDLIEHRYRHFK